MIAEFPLLVFTVLTGIAAGGYVGAALFAGQGAGQGSSKTTGIQSRPQIFPICVLVLVAVGGLSAMAHLGRPALVLNVLNNPTSSLTLEGMSAGVLGLVALIDIIICKRQGQPNKAVRYAGLVVGLICMGIVTSAYVTSYGNVAWMSASTWPLFIVGDIAAGFAFWMLFAGEPRKLLLGATAAAQVVFACVLAWQAAVFAGLGQAGVACIIAGIVCAVAAAAVSVAALRAQDGRRANVLVIAIAILAVAALIISRWGFYMASII